LRFKIDLLRKSEIYFKPMRLGELKSPEISQYFKRNNLNIPKDWQKSSSDMASSEA